MSGARLVRRIVSTSPCARTPDALLAFPAITSRAPTMSVRYAAAGEPICGLRSLLIAHAKLAALTGAPVLNRKPGLIWNVYALPS